jgi:hypothetical protein
MPRHEHSNASASDARLPGLIIPVSYRDQWQDGLGARGWKMDRAIGDPVLIATTAYSGEKVPTSVLIHDMLDHFVSGFGLSGHRNEAKATMQLGLRTGAEIASSYAQLAEDIIVSGINGESLEEFLPPAMHALLPATAATARERIAALIATLDRTAVKAALLEQLWTCGNLGRAEAQTSWRRYGLDYARRSAIGLSLQQLMEGAERYINDFLITAAQAQFIIGNAACAITFTAPGGFSAHRQVDSATHPSPDVSILTLQGRSN